MKKHFRNLLFLLVVAGLMLPAIPGEAGCWYPRYRDVSYWIYNDCTDPNCLHWYAAKVGGSITYCDGTVQTWGQTTGYDYAELNESYLCDPVCNDL